MTVYTGFVGTYTKKEGKGIHSFQLDTEKEELLNAAVAAEVNNSTYVTISENEQFLYAVAKGGKGGGLAAFKIQDAQLEKLNDVLESEGVPCYVSLNTNGTRAFSAQYHTGTAEMYSINQETGQLIDLLDVATHEGTGPNADRQEKAHTHFFGLTGDERFVVAVDLGTDEIITYEIAGEDLLKKAVFNTEPGSGPRHLVFHPSGQTAYVMTELSNEVLVLAFNENDGTFNLLAAHKAIPADFTENSQGSAIRIAQNGRFLYAGNRGHNSIAVFEVIEEGRDVKLVEIVSTKGDWPRDFDLDPTEQFLVVAHEKTNNVVLFKRNSDTGRLTPANSEVTIPEGVCVTFLRGK
ncbi:lactonase family protein [Domibacillus epiphyticus]|uniref:6-phosphogluconolactonase n=1 Tax=Domibacillus epiphyticus TaxID=1714355 RepID=A0A1V2A644_9BACI|nr:lactonase family protein [Domibacillus epiphyticus]OMP66456.1 6-phosphogluconolactonase [Domibacillus epiphyticus]